MRIKNIGVAFYRHLLYQVENDIFTYKLSYILKVVGHYTNGKSSAAQYKAYLSNGGIVIVLTKHDDINGVIERSMKSDDIRKIYETVK